MKAIELSTILDAHVVLSEFGVNESVAAAAAGVACNLAYERDCILQLFGGVDEVESAFNSVGFHFFLNVIDCMGRHGRNKVLHTKGREMCARLLQQSDLKFIKPILIRLLTQAQRRTKAFVIENGNGLDENDENTKIIKEELLSQLKSEAVIEQTEPVFAQLPLLEALLLSGELTGDESLLTPRIVALELTDCLKACGSKGNASTTLLLLVTRDEGVEFWVVGLCSVMVIRFFRAIIREC